MRILSVTAQKPHSTGSGVYLSQLVQSFAAAGHEQAVVGGVFADDEVDFPNGVAWYPVTFDTPELPFFVCGMSDEMPYPSTRYRDMTPQMVDRFKAAFVQAVGRAIETFNPDVVLVHHLYLLAATIRETFPDVCMLGICHGTCLRQLDTNPLCHDEIIAGVAKLDHIFALHEEQRSRIIRMFGVPEGRVSVLGAGYNAREFVRLPAEARQHGGLQLTFVGKVAEKKGVFSLLRALRQLPFAPGELHVTLAGGHNARDIATVRALAAQVPYEVDIPGVISQQDLISLLNGTDVFVLPSFYEGLPLVLAEALACGARVICTDLPGVRPWMDEHVPGNGIAWVEPPVMAGTDTPDETSLPAFEEQLEAVIDQALRSPAPKPCDLTGVSWDGVAATILRRYAMT